MLKKNLDFIAVAIIVLVMGIIQAPRVGVQVARMAMEQRELHLRNVRYEQRVIPLPALPPLVANKVLNYR